jgi:hypothetical protein
LGHIRKSSHKLNNDLINATMKQEEIKRINRKINVFDLSSVAKHRKPIKRPKMNRSDDIYSCGGKNSSVPNKNQPMTYTKKQRNEIYRRALGMFVRMKKERVGMCWLLQEVILTDGLFVSYSELKDILPEFGLFKREYDGMYWWELNKEGYKERLTALLFMIAMTE